MTVILFTPSKKMGSNRSCKFYKFFFAAVNDHFASIFLVPKQTKTGFAKKIFFNISCSTPGLRAQCGDKTIAGLIAEVQ